jgi:hypothetical protein
VRSAQTPIARRIHGVHIHRTEDVLEEQPAMEVATRHRPPQWRTGDDPWR